MSQPSNINIYDNHSSKDSLGIPTPPNNVRGWLMGVEGYRDSHFSNSEQQQQQQKQLQQENNNMNNNNNNNNNILSSHEYRLGNNNNKRRPSISSIASEDSINLMTLLKPTLLLM
ncbi:unnamed protein product [Cunninghamella echinulata]